MSYAPPNVTREWEIELVPNRPDWQAFGACRGMDPDIFYPQRGEAYTTALNVCRRCRVREECLEYALEETWQVGIWGGMSAKQRQALRRSQPMPGQKPRLRTEDKDPQLAAEIRAMHAAGCSLREIARRIGISVETTRRIAKTVTVEADLQTSAPVTSRAGAL